MTPLIPLIRSKRINLPLLIATALMCVFASLTLWAQQHQSVDKNSGNGRKEFSVSSSTFTDGGALPLITVWNQCSNYPGGSDESPELSWTNAPQRTESFIVVAYDVTASFTHWGIYNISGSSNGAGQMRCASGSTISSLPNSRTAAARAANATVLHHDCDRVSPAYCHPPFRHRSEIQPRTNKMGTSFGRNTKNVVANDNKDA